MFDQLEESIATSSVAKPALALDEFDANNELPDKGIAEPVTVLFILHLPTKSSPIEESR